MKKCYVVVSVDKDNDREISETANLYMDVWREWPWLENNWKKNEVIQEIIVASERADSICFLSKLAKRIIGFSWGYFVGKEQLREISGDTCLDYIFGDNEKVFYISELGVQIGHRHLGAGADISGKLIESALRMDANSFVLRTDIKAFPARGLYTKLGFAELPIFDRKHKCRSYWFKKVG
jgi:ribosomal protein S18 acetylase RimI-like enzyme